MSSEWRQYRARPQKAPVRRLLVVFELVDQGKTLEFLEKHETTLRRDIKPFTARFAGYVVIDPDEVVLALAENRPVTGVGTGRRLPLLGAPDPANRVVIGSAATRALEPAWTLLGLLGKELALIHIRSVHQAPDKLIPPFLHG